jgi:phosphate transport system substrate-binding protein
VKAFEWIYRYRPLAIEVATGSIDQPGRSPALAVYVHADNPLAKLTLGDIDAIFAGKPISMKRPTRLYTFDTESGTGRFFREIVLKDSRMLDWDRIAELEDPLAALARDRDGLAVASGPAPAGVKAIAIAGDDGVFRMPTRDEVAARRYPLARAIFAYVNRMPQGPLDAPVAAFLRYALSREGQGEVLRAGTYLPLTGAMQREELKKLEP